MMPITRRMIGAVLGALVLAGCTSEPPSPEPTAGPAEIRTTSAGSDFADPDLDLAPPEGSGELALPSVAFRMSKVGTTESLPYATAEAFGMADDYGLDDGEALAAPKGYGFIVAELKQFDTILTQNSTPPGTTVLINDLSADATYSAPVFTSGADTTGLLVVAEKSADITVQITHEFAIATMDLRTGERDESLTQPNTSLYYPLGTGAGSTVRSTAAMFTVTATLDGAASYAGITFYSQGPIRLEPWSREHGWADAGAAWLILDGPLFLDAVGDDLPPLTVTRENDPITITPADGEPVTPVESPGIDVRNLDGTDLLTDGDLHFSVPLDARTFTLTFAPTPYDAAGTDYYGSWTPGSVTLEFV